MRKHTEKTCLAEIEDCITIGIDVEDPVRFKDQDGKGKLYARVFSPSELKYCFSKRFPWIHLAGRFAAKEAVIKAASKWGKKKPGVLRHREMEIVNDANGTPIVKIHNRAWSSLSVRVSISHIDFVAVACALVVNRSQP